MASTREIRKRIRSVKNIGQITRALEAVSASRVRKAQARVLASRAYAEKAWEILLNVQAAGQGGGAMHPLLAIDGALQLELPAAARAFVADQEWYPRLEFLRTTPACAAASLPG